MTIAESWALRLSRILRDNGSRPFLIEAGGRNYSYGEVFDRAAACVHLFRAKGLKKSDRIGVLMPNGTNFAILYLACLFGGFVAVPVNDSLSPRDREYIMTHSHLKLLLVSPERAGAIPQTLTGVAVVAPDEIFAVADGDVMSGEVEELIAEIADECLFSIHFTSGTTSLPKGVPHRVGALLGNADAFNRAFGITASSRFLHVMPMAYMAGFLNTLLCPLAAGASVVLAPQFSAQTALRFWEPIVALDVDTVWVSPTMLATLTFVDRGAAGPAYCHAKSIRFFSATAPLPLPVRRKFSAKYGADPIESYGLSELLLITANEGPEGTKDGSVGRPIDEARLEFRDESGLVLPANVDGDLFVQSPHATAGYLDYNSGNPLKFSGDWFDTGDIGHIDDDGYLYITGRRKDLIIRGGFNISPRQVEEIIADHEAVENVAVLGMPHEFYGEEVVAALVLRAGYDLAAVEQQLRVLCLRDLGLAPDRVIAVAKLPAGPTGKVIKSAVRTQLSAAS
jgi:acyl-CoA synthetase (AMP-forming)/AMP-acid ligase II